MPAYVIEVRRLYVARRSELKQASDDADAWVLADGMLERFPSVDEMNQALAPRKLGVYLAKPQIRVFRVTELDERGLPAKREEVAEISSKDPRYIAAQKRRNVPTG